MMLHHQAESLSGAEKQVRVRAFLDKLAEDKSLNKAGAAQSAINNGSAADISGSVGSVNVADVLTGLLREQGLGRSSEELVEHVLEGGSVEAFLNRRQNER
ncbi:hypothetical protein M3223_13020 [Paenibacillus pasadenensis]|uniref:hypothetical protein n=1 Tax=Paenibacillus pasadenensis TaxID=217090 RepID=UPI002041F51A|nr:hypothetical protein [Paenibacillus pasadenensis]MCM3748276.1 hypothetical protein [Paenibacillus pasadenensis]